VRQEAGKLAEKKDLDLILTDGPPGVGCPVIASIGGAAAAGNKRGSGIIKTHFLISECGFF